MAPVDGYSSDVMDEVAKCGYRNVRWSAALSSDALAHASASTLMNLVNNADAGSGGACGARARQGVCTRAAHTAAEAAAPCVQATELTCGRPRSGIIHAQPDSLDSLTMMGTLVDAVLARHLRFVTMDECLFSGARARPSASASARYTVAPRRVRRPVRAVSGGPRAGCKPHHVRPRAAGRPAAGRGGASWHALVPLPRHGLGPVRDRVHII